MQISWLVSIWRQHWYLVGYRHWRVQNALARNLLKEGRDDNDDEFEKYSTDTRSNCPEVLCKKGVLRNFAKFTAKHLCQSLFFNKVAGLRQNTFSYRRPLAFSFWDTKSNCDSDNYLIYYYVYSCEYIQNKENKRHQSICYSLSTNAKREPQINPTRR